MSRFENLTKQGSRRLVLVMLYFSLGTMVLSANFACLMGPKGEQGDPGENGSKGEPGENGKDGNSCSISSTNAGTDKTNITFKCGDKESTVEIPHGKEGGSGAGVGKYQGLTTAKTDGNAGGWTGIKALCDAQYKGSHMCTQNEIEFALQNGDIPGSHFPSTGGSAWIGGSGYPVQSEGNTQCVGWTSSNKDNPSSPEQGTTLYNPFPSGKNYFVIAWENCSKSWPVACCK